MTTIESSRDHQDIPGLCKGIEQQEGGQLKGLLRPFTTAIIQERTSSTAKAPTTHRTSSSGTDSSEEEVGFLT